MTSLTAHRLRFATHSLLVRTRAYLGRSPFLQVLLFALAVVLLALLAEWTGIFGE